jgi:hypothetical protein
MSQDMKTGKKIGNGKLDEDFAQEILPLQYY